MIYQTPSGRCENVYKVSSGAPATLANLQALWTVFRDWENATARAGRSNSIQLVLITLTANDNAGAPYYEAAVLPVIGGTVVVVPLPMVNSVAIKFTTGQQGRSKRGRSYWIGLTVNHTVNFETLTVAWASNLVGYYNTLRASLVTAGFPLQINSLYSGVTVVNGYRRAVPRAAGVLTPVTSVSCEVGLDTQRHRKLPYQV
jgi:hypothetical protein